MSDSDDNFRKRGVGPIYTHISLHSLQPWNWDCVAELIFGRSLAWFGGGMTFAMSLVGWTSSCDTAIALLRASSMDSVSD
jgi:hypothetical protein